MKKIVVAAITFVLSMPAFADHIVTSCGLTADLPIDWNLLSENGRNQRLMDIDRVMCGSNGESARVEDGPRPSPTTEPDSAVEEKKK